YIFRWMGKKFLSADQQEEAGILTPEVKQRLAAAYNEAGEHAAAAIGIDPTPAPGQTALFNQWEDAVECAKCGGRMVRTGSCNTCDQPATQRRGHGAKPTPGAACRLCKASWRSHRSGAAFLGSASSHSRRRCCCPAAGPSSRLVSGSWFPKRDSRRPSTVSSP